MDIIDKLKIKPDVPLWIINMPPNSEALFTHKEINTSLRTGKQIAQIVLFITDAKELYAKLDVIADKLADSFVFWIAYPKKSGSIRSDIAHDSDWEKLPAKGFMGVGSAAINNDWGGLRVKKIDINANYKRNTPISERKTEGIDYVNRTVVLPQDALNAIKQHKGLDSFFYAMSFSHKKEYLESLAEAKKPETRTRRIEKMVTMVLQLKTLKEQKSKLK